MVKKVSILVAVHNSADWLPRCLHSLCTQSYNNVEVVCVDDASTDGSLLLLQQFAIKYNNLKISSLAMNSGPAVARNEAFRLSTGDYIMMVDSDDWLSPDAVEKAVAVLDACPDTASVLFRMVYHDAVTGVEEDFPDKRTADVLDGAEAMRLALDWDIHGLYLARRALYEAYPFDTASFLYSDDNTARRHYLHSGKVRFCDGVYYYLQHKQSMLHNPGIHYADWLEATASLKQMLVDEHQSEAYINHIEERLWQNIVAVSGYYWRYGHTLTADERLSVLHRIRKHHAAAEPARLPLSLKCKFGFIPFKRCFSLFMAQTRIYFSLRKAIKGV